jgi:uncharacterized protein YegP (UPF0339 family)
VDYLFSLLEGWPRFQVRQFGEGHYRWVLLTKTDRVLARSAGPYGTVEECLRAIDAVRRATEHAEVDTTLVKKLSKPGSE